MADTNSIHVKMVRVKGRYSYDIELSLDDDCKNGSEDFSIVGYKYPKGKPHTDCYCVIGGAIGHELSKVFSDLKLFSVLHLASFDGVPYGVIGNGMYFMTEDKWPVEKWCSCYNTTPEYYSALYPFRYDAIGFQQQTISLGLTEKWKKMADEAIAKLEKLSGNHFVSKATKPSMKQYTEEELASYKEKLASGYYTEEAVEKRALAVFNHAWDLCMQRDREYKDNQIRKIEQEYSVCSAVKTVLKEEGIPANFDDFIYYEHTNTVNFFWHSYSGYVTDDVKEKVRKAIVKLQAKYPEITWKEVKSND